MMGWKLPTKESINDLNINGYVEAAVRGASGPKNSKTSEERNTKTADALTNLKSLKGNFSRNWALQLGSSNSQLNDCFWT